MAQSYNIVYMHKVPILIDYCIKCKHYSNLAQNQMLFYKHEQCIVPNNYKYEKKNINHTLRWDVTTDTLNLLKKLLNFGIKPKSVLHASATHVPDHGTQYEENSFSHYGGMHEDELTDWTPLLSCHTNFNCKWSLILLPKQQG